MSKNTQSKKQPLDLKASFSFLIFGIVFGIVGGLFANVIHDIASSSEDKEAYYIAVFLGSAYLVYRIYAIMKKLEG